ncbi:MAG: hypothetical protein AB1567_10540, partial [bacterium]
MAQIRKDILKVGTKVKDLISKGISDEQITEYIASERYNPDTFVETHNRVKGIQSTTKGKDIFSIIGKEVLSILGVPIEEEKKSIPKVVKEPTLLKSKEEPEIFKGKEIVPPPPSPPIEIPFTKREIPKVTDISEEAFKNIGLGDAIQTFYEIGEKLDPTKHKTWLREIQGGIEGLTGITPSEEQIKRIGHPGAIGELAGFGVGLIPAFRVARGLGITQKGIQIGGKTIEGVRIGGKTFISAEKYKLLPRMAQLGMATEILERAKTVPKSIQDETIDNMLTLTPEVSALTMAAFEPVFAGMGIITRKAKMQWILKNIDKPQVKQRLKQITEIKPTEIPEMKLPEQPPEEIALPTILKIPAEEPKVEIPKGEPIGKLKAIEDEPAVVRDAIIKDELLNRGFTNEQFKEMLPSTRYEIYDKELMPGEVSVSKGKIVAEKKLPTIEETKIKEEKIAPPKEMPEEKFIETPPEKPKKELKIEESLKVSPQNIGKTTQAFDNKNNVYNMQYEVIEAKNIIPSHTETFTVNPKYPQELQPRERERKALQLQVKNLSQTLNPERLLTDTKTLQTGTPIIGKADNIVESGNARIIALLTSPKYPEYQKMLIDKAGEFGIDAD